MRLLLKAFIIVLFSLLASRSFSQEAASDLTWLDHVISVLHSNQEMDAEEKSDLADSAFHLAEKIHDICRQVNLRIKQATYLDNMGLSDSALVQLFWVHKRYHQSCDSLLLMSLYVNFTNVYLSLNELSGVDSIGKLALQLWNPGWKEKDTKFAVLNNMAISKAIQGDMQTATRMFHQTYQEASQAEDASYIQKSLINLGSIKGMTEDFDSAFVYFSMALERAKSSEAVEDYAGLLINLADLERSRGNYSHGLHLLDSAFVLAERINSTEHQANTQQTRALVYAAKSDYKNAYKYMLEYLTLREKILDEEKIRSVTEMMEKYESEKKARQIQQLELDKLDASLQNERITNTRNRYLLIGIAIFLAALGLWGRLRYVHKARAAIQREKDVSEGLLLNILPASVADELKTKGFADAKHFEPVTILFSDFKDFTTISEELSAAELVQELNACFKTFDDIMTKYGIEKIKTIGDSYMAAGSIPATNTATPVDVINAGLDMQEFVTARKKERSAQRLPAFDMRVGLHSGPVVAGIVGVKKFQYDLWGDTVNIASRMETNGEIGRVNISEVTYELVKYNPTFTFTPRGLVNVKGKGELIMYFVERSVV